MFLKSFCKISHIKLTLLKVTLIHGCFSRFLNCHNGTKLRKASHINTEEETEMYSMNSETRFFPMYPFEPLWEYQKTVGFVTFAGKIKRKYQEKNILATSFIVRFEKCLRFLFVSFLLTLTMFLF